DATTQAPTTAAATQAATAAATTLPAQVIVEDDAGVAPPDYSPPVTNTEKVYTRTWGNAPKPAQFTAHAQSSTGLGGIGIYVIESLYQRVRSTDRIHPRIADGMPVHEGNKSTVKMRTDVTFNDGEQCTSKDIKSFYLINQNVRINQYLSSIECPDDYTIVFNWLEPTPNETIRNAFIADNGNNAAVPYHIFGKYVDEHERLLDSCPELTDGITRGPFNKDISGILDDLAQNWTDYQSHEIPNLKPIGTGPYILETLTDTEFIMVKRPDYYRADEVYFDKVHNIEVTNEQGIAMLRNAQTDSYPGSLPLDIAESVLRSNKDIVFYQTVDPACHGFYFNRLSTRAPMDKMEFRQAINYIVEKKPLREAGNYYGTEFEYATTGGLPPGTVQTYVSQDVQDKLRRYTKDHAKAEELLASIGITKGAGGVYQNEDGSPIKIILGVNSGWQPAGVVTNVTSLVCDQLKAFGLDAEVLAVEGSVYATMMDSNEEFDMSFEWIDIASSYLIPYFPIVNFYQGCFRRQGTPVDENTNKIMLKLNDWDGVEFDVTEYLDKIPITSDEAEVQMMIDRLVWAANEYAFGINLYQNATGVWENRANTKNLPMEHLLDTGNAGFPQWIVQPTDPTHPEYEAISELNWGFSGIEKLIGPKSLAPR
ncbi:MAG: ABC transporter substrate-binding protein, partial [Oscillospiraceae bacterium]|nr:ABC transporter substrate-binding protein [Oscillospiraceae bacterium]